MFSAIHVRPGQLLPLLALIAFWALIQGGVAALNDTPLLDTKLAGPDSYMRMVRVTELAQGGGWFDGSIARANAPYGDVLHWTRPFDVLILMLALPASIAVETNQALYIAGLIVSPLLHLATAFLLIWALRPVIRPATSFLPAIAIFLQPAVLAYSNLGRADHHSLLMLVFVVAAGFVLRVLRDPLDVRSALFAGAAAGFGIWLSVEFLLTVAISLAALGLPWLLGERGRATQSKWYAFGLSAVLLLALFAERSIGHLLDASYDRVSGVQYFLAVSILLFWVAMEALETRRRQSSGFVNRAALACSGLGGIFLLLNFIYPLFFAGPMAEVDQRILPIWLNHVMEMLPLAVTDRYGVGKFIFYLGGIALIALPLLKVLFDERGSPRFFAYAFVAIACLLFTLVTLRHLRFAGYAEISSVIAFAMVLDHFLRWSSRFGNDLLRGVLRGSLIGAMLTGPIFVGATLMVKPAAADAAAKQAQAGCNVRQVASFLETDPRWAADPQTVLAFMDIGPELLYRTPHRVIGTPYHRNADGIFDGHRILSSNDDTAAFRLVQQRGIDLVLLCRSQSERAFYTRGGAKDNLYLRLDSGAPPPWLAAIELPAPLQEQALLYRVLR